MKRLLKSWVIWAFVLPPFASLAALLVGHVRSDDICPGCVSTRVRTGWYAGTPDHRLPVVRWEPSWPNPGAGGISFPSRTSTLGP
jgi:hypothetical protein